MIVWIDEGCIACGACQEICPDVFQVDETCEVIEDNIPGNETEILEAAENCPVEVIIIEKEEDDDYGDEDDDEFGDDDEEG